MGFLHCRMYKLQRGGHFSSFFFLKPFLLTEVLQLKKKSIQKEFSIHLSISGSLIFKFKQTLSEESLING